MRHSAVNRVVRWHLPWWPGPFAFSFFFLGRAAWLCPAHSGFPCHPKRGGGSGNRLTAALLGGGGAVRGQARCGGEGRPAWGTGGTMKLAWLWRGGGWEDGLGCKGNTSECMEGSLRWRRMPPVTMMLGAGTPPPPPDLCTHCTNGRCEYNLICIAEFSWKYLLI